MYLARIDSAAENEFIFSNTPIDAWIGASDQTVEGQWRWSNNNDQFWSGGSGGTTVGGRYANWKPVQPDNFFNQDCAAIELFASGQWADRACGELLEFVCERPLDVGEPGFDCAVDAALADAPWPGFRRCPTHQGTTSLIGAQDAEPFVTYETDGDIDSSPIVDGDGTIYFGSHDGYLYALHPDLTLKWRYPTLGPVRSSPALAADGTIYVGSNDGRVHAVNPDGSNKWAYPTFSPVRSSPVVGPDGRIYVGSDNTRFYALTPAGAKIWDVDTISAVRSSAAISPDGTIYIGFEDWQVVALNPDGSEKWAYATLGPVTSSPAIGPDGTIYVGCYDGNLYALHPGSGTLKWAYSAGSPITSSPAITQDGTIVFGADDGFVRAINSDSSHKWEYETGDAVRSSPAIGADGIVYIGSTDIFIYALDIDDGSVVWILGADAMIESSPAIGADGKIYIGSYDNRLYAVGPGCSPASPCGNGEGPCSAAEDCEASLACGFGIGPKYGKPDHFGVCWDPGACATLNPVPCGSPLDLCGDCCVPQCGSAGGGSNGCGGTCETCVPGADSDLDGITDCEERSDGDAWTDPLVYNGVNAQRGDACHVTPSCAAIDTRTEIQACFEPDEDNILNAGWDFATTDRDVCDEGFDFQRPWSGCGENFAVRYRGSMKILEGGIHCFAINGGTANQCGALYFGGSSSPVLSSGGISCFELGAETYPVEWFYETTSTGLNEFHVDYCFGGSTSCVPTSAIPAEILRPESDGDERVCAAGGPCTELCPCDAGRPVSEASHCALGLVLRTDVAHLFGLPPGTPICWDAVACDSPSSPLFSCGTTESLCGLCPTCTPNCDGRSCGYDGCYSVCGPPCSLGGAGCLNHDDCADGLVCIPSESGLNQCRPPRCASPSLNPCSDPANSGLLTECGPCPACIPACDGKECGSDGCGGDCGDLEGNEFCTPDGVIGDIMTWAYSGPTPPEDDADTPGTLPGRVDVTELGQAAYTIPLTVPAGRAGIQPNLALSYSSASGNGYLGMGWGLTGLSAIQRCAKTIAQDGTADIIRYTGDDRFCLDGLRLVLEDDSEAYGADGTHYRTEFDTFSRIVSHGSGVEPDYFKVYTRDGRVMTYAQRVGGNTPRTGPGVRPPDATDIATADVRTHTWALTSVEDRVGNAMSIRYRIPSVCNPDLPPHVCPIVVAGIPREYYPEEISYTAHETAAADRTVKFEYVSRRDNLSGYHQGILFERTQLLSRIVASVQGKPVFVYKLSYEQPDVDGEGNVGPDNIHETTLLSSVTWCGRQTIDPTAEFEESCMPPTEFSYEKPLAGFVEGDAPSIELPDIPAHQSAFFGPPIVLDLDGNGQDDVLFSRCSSEYEGDCFDLEWDLALNGEAPDPSLIEDRDRLVPFGAKGRIPARTYVIDYDLDGRDDVIEVDAAYRNGEDGSGPVRLWSFKEFDGVARLRVQDVTADLGQAFLNGQVYMLDANGDQVPDLLACKMGTGSSWDKGTWRIHYHNRTSGFEPPVTLTASGPRCSAGAPIDLNGDGRQELMLNALSAAYIGGTGRTEYAGGGEPWSSRQPSGVFWPEPVGFSANLVPPRGDNSVRLVIDVNGDGLRDVADFGEDYKARVWLSTGTGFVSQSEHTLNLADSIAGLLPYGPGEFLQDIGNVAVAFDENGDGRVDLLARARFDRWVVLRSMGDRFVVRPLPAELNIGPGNYLTVYDIDHDGISDVREQTQTWIRRGASGYRLSSVTNGLGARSEIEYAHLGQGDDGLILPLYFGDLSTTQCPGSCYERRPRGAVVRRTKFWDEVYLSESETPAKRSVLYGYGQAASDLLGRGSLGFGVRYVLDVPRYELADMNGSLHVSISTYGNTIYDASMNAYPFVGRVLSHRVLEGTNNGRTRETTSTREPATDYPSDQSAFYYFGVEQTNVRERANGDETYYTLSEIERTWSYDGYGNLTQYTESAGAGDLISVDTDYTTDEAHDEQWLISAPRSRIVRSERDGLIVERETEFVYAEDPEVVGPSFLEFSGLPLSVISERGDADEELTTDYEYTALGQVEEVSTAGTTVDGVQTRTNVLQYSSGRNFPVLSIDDRGHEVSLLYDDVLGIAIGTIQEGQPGTSTQSYAYIDGFGRLRRIYDPDGTTTEIEYELDASTRGMRVRTNRVGAPERLVRYDVLGRESEVEFDGFERRLVVETQYNAMGLVQARSRAHSAGSAEDFKDFTYAQYDSLGRLTLTELPDSEQVEYCYVNNVSCTRDPKSATSCRVFNTHGQLAYSIDPRASDTSTCQAVAEDVADAFPIGAAPAASSFSSSSYLYGPFGAVRAILDPDGNETAFEYDRYSRVTRRTDADAGVWRYTYNAFGELQSQIANGKKLVYRYDDLGRPTTVTELDSLDDDTEMGAQTLFIHDTLFGGGFQGKLIAAVTPEGVATSYSYDVYGRLETLTKAVPGDDATETLTRHYDYEPDTGRLSVVSYGSAIDEENPLRVRYRYNTEGHLDRLSQPDPADPDDPSDDSMLWQAIDSDPYGKLTTERVGEAGNSIETTRSYHANTGRLNRLQAVHLSTSTVVQDWIHQYDGNGNVESRTNIREAGEITSYAYDELNRLEAAVTADAALSSTLHAEGYTYDRIGNVLTKSVTDAASSSSTVLEYEYDDGSGEQPRAVKSVSDGTDTQQYLYDSVGNLEVRQVGLWSGFQVEYDHYNRTSRIDGTGLTTDTLFDYDAHGIRARKRSSSPLGETFYLDDAFTRHHVPGTSGYVERLVVSNGSRAIVEIVREASSTETATYLHQDHLGSVEVLTDPSSSTPVLERRKYEAFGKLRDVSGASPFGSRGAFTGHELDDEFGLINMQARLYDPEIGRFLAPDPVLAEPGWSQGLNPYSYVRNNPLNWIDPSGNEAVTAGTAAAYVAVTVVAVALAIGFAENGELDLGEAVNDVLSFFGFGDDGDEEEEYTVGNSRTRVLDPGSEVGTSVSPQAQAPDSPAPTSTRREGQCGFPCADDPETLRQIENLRLFGEEMDRMAERVDTALTVSDVVFFGGTRTILGRGLIKYGAREAAEAAVKNADEVAAAASRAGGAAERAAGKALPERGPFYVDSKGNAIPTPKGGSVTGSPDGRFVQARDAAGNPTGVRIDGPHRPATHPDPRAQQPHGHVPGVTNPDGTPWLPIRQ